MVGSHILLCHSCRTLASVASAAPHHWMVAVTAGYKKVKDSCDSSGFFSAHRIRPVVGKLTVLLPVRLNCTMSVKDCGRSFCGERVEFLDMSDASISDHYLLLLL